jgi:aspartate/methionine/tyrosine aminotransferase
MIIDVAQRLHTTKEYYFSKKLQEVRSYIADGRDIINMAIGNPDLPPSEDTIKVLCEEAEKPENHGYQPYRGIPQLREAIAKWYKSAYGVGLDADREILPLIGSKEGITHISLAFLNPGDRVLVPEIGYPSYRAVAEMVGAHVETYPLLEDKDWQPDAEALENMDMSGVKLLWLNYPHMPTGATARKSTFERLVSLARQNKVLLCHDNPYSLILNSARPLSLLSIDGAMEVAIELNSMSKSHNMAGWRVGWLCGQADYIDHIIKIKTNVDSGMFKPLQLAAAAAFDAPDSWHAARNDIYRKRRELVYAFLDSLGCTYSTRQEGLFIWARIPQGVPDAETFTEALLAGKNIFIAPGFIFGAKGNRYVRVSLCVREETLHIALKRIKDFNWQSI